MTHNLQRVHFRSFEELKRNAYDAAMIGVQEQCNELWEQNYLELYAPTSYRKEWRDAIRLYVQYIKNEISKDEAEKNMQRIKDSYAINKNRINDAMHNMFKFMGALNQAFEEVDDETLKTFFTCPICQGEAFANRLYQNNSSQNHVVTHGKCNSCGFTIML